MDREPRKATDVLLDLESKIENLLLIVRSQDLNLKLLSNKLNSVLEKLDSQPTMEPKFTVEAVQNPQVNKSLFTPEPANEIVDNDPEFNLKIENSPQGFRRTSRPETFNPSQVKTNDGVNVFPMQLPKMPPGRSEGDAEVIVAASQNSSPKKQVQAPSDNSIPLMQRVVDKNGKSVFLADVEIINLSNNEIVAKTRTNGTGKWMASLPIGRYRISIKKRESLTKEKLEVTQDIQVDGSQSPFDLQTIIVK